MNGNWCFILTLNLVPETHDYEQGNYTLDYDFAITFGLVKLHLTATMMEC